MSKLFKVGKYLAYGAAVILSLCLLGLWILNSELSQMALLLRFWYLYVASMGLVVLGGAFSILEG
jgi:hypothetical protein